MYNFKQGEELYANFKYFFDVLSVNGQDIELQYFHRGGYPNTEINKAILKLPLSAVTFVEHMGNYIAVKVDEKQMKEKLGSIFDNILVQSDVYNMLKEDVEVTVGGDVDMEPSHDFVVMNRKEFLKMNKGKGVVDLRNTKSTLNSLKKMGDQLNHKFYPKNFKKGFYKFDTFDTIYESAKTIEHVDINSPEFKSWFNGSKIVDKNKKPLIVYHGTSSEFDKFDPNKKGSNTEWYNANAGFFFLANKEYVKQFLGMTSNGNIIMSAYLNIKNPIDLTLRGLFSKKGQASTILKMIGYDYENFEDYDLIDKSPDDMTPAQALKTLSTVVDLGDIYDLYEQLFTTEAMEIMKQSGYDGIIATFTEDDDRNDILEYVALEPEQIKIVSVDKI